jgi:hypothetical protein
VTLIQPITPLAVALRGYDGEQGHRFALRVGITGNQLSRLVGGQAAPPLWLARRIADELGLEVAELFPEISSRAER